ncbi:MAG: hypothetical protein ABL898_01730 [Hyphomicrobiaceae bacterium]|nr:hypothetical protein [Hyphomicrobiaceae bacterium]
MCSELEIEQRYSGAYVLEAEERADIFEASTEGRHDDVACPDMAQATFQRLVN